MVAKPATLGPKLHYEPCAWQGLHRFKSEGDGQEEEGERSEGERSPGHRSDERGARARRQNC